MDYNITDANFNTVMNFAQGQNLLDKNITSIADAAEKDVRLRKSNASDLFFIHENAIHPNNEVYITNDYGFLDEVQEGERPSYYTPKTGRVKGYKLKTFSKVTLITDELKAWLETNSLGDKNVQMSDSMKMLLREHTDQVKGLMRLKYRTLNREMFSIFNQATVDTNSYGAGSPSPDGKALAANGRTTLSGDTWGNLFTGAFTAAKLQEMMNGLRDALWDNGQKVGPLDAGAHYTLMYPSSIADKVLTELNTLNGQVTEYAGSGENSKKYSLFVAPGFKVRLFESPLFEAKDYNGSETQFHLVSGDLALELGAFRHITKDNFTRLETQRDALARGTNVVYSEMYSVDHYIPQVIATSTGV